MVMPRSTTVVRPAGRTPGREGGQRHGFAPPRRPDHEAGREVDVGLDLAGDDIDALRDEAVAPGDHGTFVSRIPPIGAHAIRSVVPDPDLTHE
jgi:hypothetical protein